MILVLLLIDQLRTRIERDHYRAELREQQAETVRAWTRVGDLEAELEEFQRIHRLRPR